MRAGRFSGSHNVASELTWTDTAAGASALQMVAPAVREAATAGGLAYEAHRFAVSLPDFLCAIQIPLPPSCPLTSPRPNKSSLHS